MRLLALAFVALYAAAWLWPEAWWGLHWLAFLPAAWQVALPVLAVAAWAAVEFAGHRLMVTAWTRNRWIVVSLAVALLAGLLYYNAPMAASLYGDSEAFSEKLGERTTKL